MDSYLSQVDKIDRKILYALDFNARQSARRIGAKVGLSKDAVNYRINRLEKGGVIRRYYAVLDTLSLGFLHFSTLFRFRNITDKLKNSFVEFCAKHERVIWCVTCFGSWDFGVSFLAKDVKEYDLFMAELMEKFGNEIHEKAMLLMLDSPTYTREFLIGGKEGKEFKYRAAQRTEIDPVEHQILVTIAHQGRLNAVGLAKSTGLSPDIVRYRISKLEDQGIVQGFRASIDISELGYSYYKILFSVNDFTLKNELRFREFCRCHPNILQFIKYLGQYEVQLEVEIEPEKIYSLIEKIRKECPTVIKTYEVLRLKEHKLNYYPFGSEKE